MVELLVVISIALIIVAAAVPAVRVLTGSRSIANASNIISAMLARAHQEAVYEQQYCGVFFFLDTTVDKTCMALVTTGQELDPDPTFDAYKGWTPSLTSYQTTTGATLPPVQYYNQNTAAGDNGPSFVVNLSTLGNDPLAINGIPKLTLIKYSCSQSHNNPGSGNEAGTAAGTNWWGTSGLNYLQPVLGVDVQYLPSGVACQVVNDPLGSPLLPTGAGSYDRYLRTSVILFDSLGRFDSVPWAVHSTGPLAYMINGGNALPQDLNFSAANNMPILWSGFGVAIYDREAIRGGQLVIQGSQSPTATFNFTENDHIFTIPALGSPASSVVDEANEELWLDNNAMILFVNRNGAGTFTGY